MTEESGEAIMDRTSTIGLATTPILIGLQVQQQLLHAAGDMGRAMCSLNPFLRPFIR